jgi:transcription initiation factor TFIIH subunit 3
VTRGIYMQLSSPLGLLQYLMMAFLPDQTSRRHLVLPTQVDVDFRAACFCHKRVVDAGFVCSICLSSMLFYPIFLMYIYFLKITLTNSTFFL